jgi:hypothetical protein
MQRSVAQRSESMNGMMIKAKSNGGDIILSESYTYRRLRPEASLLSRPAIDLATSAAFQTFLFVKKRKDAAKQLGFFPTYDILSIA